MLLLVLRFPSEPDDRLDPATGVPPSLLSLRCLPPAPPGDAPAGIVRDTRGDGIPSSFRSASAVLSSLAATCSTSGSNPAANSRVWRRIEAAMMEGDEWCEWVE